jgi:hypothetical protein
VSSGPSSVVVFGTLKCDSLFLFITLFLALFKAYRAFRLALATIWPNLRQAALGLSASDSLKVQIVYYTAHSLTRIYEDF